MPASPRMLTFTGGGWVLALAGFICLGIITWAVAPAILRTIHRPPGDGKTIESYGFDLSNLIVPRDLISPATLHRDMVPVLTHPTHSDMATMQRRNDPKYGKYLVSNDRIIGVTINGESRAYPLHVMYVHEIINDELGGVPIAVIYNWLCDSTVVFDRRVVGGRGSTVELAVSGLVFNSNLLMYDRNEFRADSAAPVSGGGNESLWSQLLMKPVSGRAVSHQESMLVAPYELTTWSDWLERHPKTTVVDRNLGMTQRYKDAAPLPYFRSDVLLHPVRPLSDGVDLQAKTPVVAVSVGAARRVYPMPFLVEQARRQVQLGSAGTSPEWIDQLGGTAIRFVFSRNLQTVRVDSAAKDWPIRATHAYWFAWHAMYPEDERITK